MSATKRTALKTKLPDARWIPVSEKLPRQNQRVWARYVGVYNPKLVTFWRDDVNTHFGNPPASEPASHWKPFTPHAQPAAKPKRPAAGKRKSVAEVRAAGLRIAIRLGSHAPSEFANGYAIGYRAAQRRAAK